MCLFRRVLLAFSLVAITAVSAGCSKEDGGAGTLSTTAPSPMEARFDPAASVIPFPNNLLFSGSLDGTLNMPVANPADITDPKVAMNALDGFSTIAPITTTFTLPISGASVPLAVKMYEVTTAGPLAGYAVTGVVAPLAFGVDFYAMPSPGDARVLAIKPLKPLKSNTNYMVVVSNTLQSTAGNVARPSNTFALLKQTSPLVVGGISQVPGASNAQAAQLEQLRQLNQATLAVAAAAGTPKANVAIAWSFKTQTINRTLAAIRANIGVDPYAIAANFISVPAAPSAATGNLGVLDFYTFALAQAALGNVALRDAYTATLGTAFNKLGSVVIGAVNLPYYIDAYSVANPTAPITSQFAVNAATGLPAVKSVQAVPFILTTPNTPGPWKVAIFQHGFTVDKSAMFGIANSLAAAGYATIAIDSVLHGNRTFNLDLINNTTGAPGADGIADPSGKWYMNLKSLLTTRDNIRQNVADLMHLSRLIQLQTMDVVANATGLPGADLVADLQTTGIVYVGHSNGGILGTVLAAVDQPAGVLLPSISAFVLANPGGGYADTLRNSPTFGPVVNAGLASSGVPVGSPKYEPFFVAAQTVTDDGDPLNYAATAAVGKNILLLKTLNDPVVPNVQTDLLSIALGLKQVSVSVPPPLWPVVALPPVVGSGFISYTVGDHSTFLTPGSLNANIVPYTAMQTDTANYLGSAALGAATITISNAAVVQ